MSRRKSPTTKQVRAEHWDNHETVLIRSLNTEDEEYITDNLVALDTEGRAVMHAGRSKRLTLVRGIVSWTLTDDNGRRIDLSEAAIKALAPEDSQYILDEINAISKSLSAEEKKASTTSATPGTGAAAA